MPIGDTRQETRHKRKDTRDKTQDTRPQDLKTQDTRHKTQDTRRKTQDTKTQDATDKTHETSRNKEEPHNARTTQCQNNHIMREESPKNDRRITRITNRESRILTGVLLELINKTRAREHGTLKKPLPTEDSRRKTQGESPTNRESRNTTGALVVFN